MSTAAVPGSIYIPPHDCEPHSRRPPFCPPDDGHAGASEMVSIMPSSSGARQAARSALSPAASSPTTTIGTADGATASLGACIGRVPMGRAVGGSDGRCGQAFLQNPRWVRQRAAPTISAGFTIFGARFSPKRWKMGEFSYILNPKITHSLKFF